MSPMFASALLTCAANTTRGTYKLKYKRVRWGRVRRRVRSEALRTVMTTLNDNVAQTPPASQNVLERILPRLWLVRNYPRINCEHPAVRILLWDLGAYASASADCCPKIAQLVELRRRHYVPSQL